MTGEFWLPSDTPIRRITSATGVPVSACRSAYEICSSVYLDFFTACSSSRVVTQPENFHSNRRKKTGDFNAASANQNNDRATPEPP